MGRALDRRWRRLAGAVDAYGPASGDADLHRIRILSRRARFTCDALVPVFGPQVAELAARLADVQSVLGDEHDAVITAGWYGAAAAGAPPRVVADLGLLSALAGARAATARRRWTTAWDRARQAAHAVAAEGTVVTFDPI
jgi:CHAD domain-containing protein